MLQRKSNFSCEEREKMEIQNFLTWEARKINAGTEFMLFEPRAMPFGTLKTVQILTHCSFVTIEIKLESLFFHNDIINKPSPEVLCMADRKHAGDLEVVK